MKHNFKRFLSLLLAMAMVIGMFPMTHAHAEEEKVQVLGEKVTAVEVGASYVICLAGTKNALTNQKGSTAWGTNTLATAVCNSVDANNTWTLENAEGGLKLKNGDSYLMVARNTAELDETGHVFELTYVDDAGWTVKSLDTAEYFNNLGDRGSIGGWSGDGTKFDIYTIAEIDADEADPWGKRNWTKVSVDTETVYNTTEGLFEYAWDGNPNSIWHSNWQGAEDKLTGENTFTGVIDFGKAYTISKFSFTPRQTGNVSGVITQASLYVKVNESDEWTTIVEHAIFDAVDGSARTICFDAQEVRYVKFVAEKSNDGWVAVSEFDVDNHEHTVTSVVTDPTCAAAGYTTYTCTCGSTYKLAGGAATGEHTPNDDDSDCTTAVACSGCGQEVVPAKTHVWPEEGVYTAPEGETAGYTTYTCTNEGCEQTKVVYDEPTEPELPDFTSEKLALTVDSFRESGNNTHEPNQGFSYLIDGIVGVNGNYWTTDLDPVADCWLEVDLGGEFLINKVEYTKRYHQGQGNGGYNCTGNLINYIIEVRVGEGEWQVVSQGPTEQQGTTVINVVPVNATHLRLRSTESYFHETTKKAITAAEFAVYKAVCVAHDYDQGVETKAPTCNEGGVMLYTCEICGDTYESTTEPTGNHTPNDDDGDCTTPVACSGCGQEVVPAKTHVWSENGVHTDPEGETAGYTTYPCTNEGCEQTKVVFDAEPELPDFTSEKLTGIQGSASSEETGERATVDKAFDGIINDSSNMENYWATAAGNGNTLENAWLIGDLGGVYTIDQVDYSMRYHSSVQNNGFNCSGNLKNYIIEVSIDRENWTQIAAGDTTFSEGTATTVIKFNAIKAQYVRLTATESYHHNSPNTVMAVSELSVYQVISNHNMGDWSVVNAATCVAKGTETRSCQDDGCEYTETRETPMIAHDWNDGEQTKAPTCTENGVWTVTCTVDGCGVTMERPIESEGHDYGALIPEVEAVHNQTTLTPAVAAHYYCAACDTYFDAEKNETTLAALTGETPVHTPAEAVKENEKAPTIDAAGSYDSVVYCSVCGFKISSETITVPAIESKIVKWYNWDGTVLYELKVAADAEVVADQYVGEPPMRAEDESFTYKFEGWVAVEGGFKAEYTATAKEPVVEADKVVMLGKEVRLESEIQMQYRVYIPESLINSGAYVVMAKTGAYGEVTKTYTVAELNVGENLVTMGVAPAEITAPISITVYDGNDVAQDLYNKDGVKLENASRTVAGYAVEILENDNSDEKLKDLAVALLTYGGYAQEYFGVNAENPAFNLLPEGYEVPNLSNVTAELLDNYRNTQTNTEMGVKATTVATYVDSNIRIRVYLAVEDDINGYTFTLKTPNGDKEVKAGYDQASKRYYVDITEIASGYIDYEYQITIKGANGTNVITASVLAYARSALVKSTDEKLQNLAKALYLYNQAADNYWPER